jgi:exosome complex component CSL4
MDQNDLVEPGTALAYSEELLPGAGTYDDGEQIRAAVFGHQRVDPDTMTITIEPAGKAVASIEKGDIVAGRVSYIKPDLASVEILGVRGKEGRSLLHQVEATLRVRNVDTRFVREMGDEFRCGDIIRAKVIATKGGPQLATDKPDLGVIRAFSKDSPRRSLQRQGNRLVDPEDGHQETRKFAEDYGSGLI